MHKITEELFHKAKKDLHWYTSSRSVATRLNLSIKTVIQIKHSITFQAYHEQSKAQHPPTLYSLKEEILELHKLTFKKDNTYIAPPTARKAIAELQANV